MRGNKEYTHESHIILVNSEDRNNSDDTTTNFKVSIGPEARQFNVSRIVLKSINLPNFMYNINSNNKTLELTTGVDGATSYTLPEGQYTTTTIIAQLESGFNALFTNTMSITQNATTHILTFAIDGGDTIALSAVTTTATSTLSPFLGISADVGAGVSVSAGSVPRLNGLTQVYIQSSRLSKQAMSKSDGKTYDYLTSIQVKEDYGSYIYWESNNPELASINFASPRKLYSEIDIVLLNQDFQELEIHGHDVSLEFIIYHA